MFDPGQQPEIPARGQPSGAAAPPAAAPPAAAPPGAACAAATCSRGTAPQSADQAVAMVLAGLAWLADADAASLPAVAQADALRGLERAASVHAAARAKVLAAFDAQGCYEDDAARSARSWLTWQTRTTPAAASSAVGWMRRLAAHPRVADALRSADLSTSWARQICDWSDALPSEARDDADLILLAAAAGGAHLSDLAGLAEQIRRRTARPDADPDGFEDRSLRLATTYGGAGTLRGDLTPRCAAALEAVLDALGKRGGPEDLRSPDQLLHDALEEACRRLIAGGLPDRAGQATQIQLHMSLDDLTGASSGNVGGDRGSRALWPGPAAAPGDDCDASIYPILTGRIDQDLLAKLAARLRSTPPGLGLQAAADARELILTNAVALLSGPDGLASLMRTGAVAGPAASVSLPLDVGTSTDTIPPHLRRAVITRDQHCAAPGCDQPPAACQIHHVIPRSERGPTALTNLVLLCTYHHLIAIHRWGWTLALNPDGTTTLTSPDRRRTYHSHSPPATAA